MSDPMSTLEARIAEVLGAHVPSGTIVACGGCSHDRHDFDPGDGSQIDTWEACWKDFADHLAEVLAPVIRESEAEALEAFKHMHLNPEQDRQYTREAQIKRAYYRGLLTTRAKQIRSNDE